MMLLVESVSVVLRQGFNIQKMFKVALFDRKLYFYQEIFQTFRIRNFSI